VVEVGLCNRGHRSDGGNVDLAGFTRVKVCLRSASAWPAACDGVAQRRPIFGGRRYRAIAAGDVAGALWPKRIDDLFARCCADRTFDNL
jgi:hypothetical protein